jgi:hypothetical protein
VIVKSHKIIKIIIFFYYYYGVACVFPVDISGHLNFFYIDYICAYLLQTEGDEITAALRRKTYTDIQIDTVQQNAALYYYRWYALPHKLCPLAVHLRAVCEQDSSATLHVTNN